MHEDWLLIDEPGFFRHDDAIRVYRARYDGDPVALVLNMVAPDGYNGDIRMLVAVNADGTISGVRVVAHRETPGLGDPIERRRSDWILSFDQRSLGNPDEQGWAVRRDGGQFDQFTGATVTPRAVVEAVQRALEFVDRHQETLYRQAPAPESMQ
jgi:electron transport complex protein RnfG